MSTASVRRVHAPHTRAHERDLDPSERITDTEVDAAPAGVHPLGVHGLVGPEREQSEAHRQQLVGLALLGERGEREADVRVVRSGAAQRRVLAVPVIGRRQLVDDETCEVPGVGETNLVDLVVTDELVVGPLPQRLEHAVAGAVVVGRRQHQ